MPWSQVEEIALVNCIVRRWDGARIWWPNTLLDTYPLVNLSRSNNKWESVEVRPAASGALQSCCWTWPLCWPTVLQS